MADIHFDYRLALEAVAAGADKIRINPGNIGDEGRVRQVVSACKAKGIPTVSYTHLVIGVTLPFFSAGGTSAAALYLGIGVVLSVYMHSRRHLFMD